MTENEFLIEYNNRFSKLVEDSIEEVLKFKDVNYGSLFQKYVEVSSLLSYNGNILISQIMNDFNIDYNYMILDNLASVPLGSALYRRSFSIQLECRKVFEQGVFNFLEEVRLQ